MRGPDWGVSAAYVGSTATFVVCSPDVSLLLLIKYTFVESWLSPAADGALFSFSFCLLSQHSTVSHLVKHGPGLCNELGSFHSV